MRAARALKDLPLTREAMARGELSFSKVRALTRVATAETEGALLELATGATTAQLERMVRAWKVGGRADEAQRERERHASRTLAVFPGDDGMHVIHGRLMPEVAAVLMKAIEAAADALYRAHPEVEPAQRRADAIALLAERALAAGFEGVDSRAERYTVVVHVDAGTLGAEGEPGRSDLEDGTRLSAESARRIACDAGRVEVAHGPDGSVLDVGRKTRTIPPALRRALEVRDRGCRFPGCGRRFTDAHHVKHWADGGGTSLANTVLLCRHHHMLVHEGGWSMAMDDEGRPTFFDPRGHAQYEARPRAIDANSAALLAENARLGIRPDPWTPSARWLRERDIPDEVYLRASGAM